MKLGDIEVGVTDVGAGPTVLFLHGLAEDRSSWGPQLDGLRDHRRVAVDLRGHGDSSLGAADGTLAQLVDDYLGVLEQVTGPASCVGFSLGGVVVLAAAAQRPDLVTQAIVLGTSSVVGRRARGFFVDRIALIQSDDWDTFAALLRSDTASQVATDVDLDALTRNRLRAIGDGGGYINAARAMIDVADHPLTPLMADIEQHVDVVGGDQDVFCPRKAADLLVDALPCASYHEIAPAGHLLNIDAPDAVTAVIDDALASCARS